MPRREAGFLVDDQGREILSGKPPVGEQGGITVDEDGARAVALMNFSGVGGGPTLADGSVTTAKIADGAVTAAKVAADVATQAELDASATASRARSSHTGTQTASTISDFDAQVRTSRLDQMAVPAADVAMGARKLTGLASGTLATDAATLSQVQAGAAGIDPKESVRALATTNLTLSGTQTVDTVPLIAGNRVLVAGQTTAPQNGIYVVAAGAWSRSPDADTSVEVTPGMHTFVEEGTHAGEGWVLSTAGAITLGTTALLFVKFSASPPVVAGAGLVSTGSTIDVSTDNSTLEVVSDQVRVKDGGITAAKVAADVATQAELDANAIADRARANHTGTQVSTTISDLTEAVQDIIGSSLAAGTGTTVSYNDPTGTTTISATGTGGTVSDSSTTVKGVVKLATAPAVATDPIAVGTNDRRLTRSVVPPWAATTLVDLYERRIAPDGREIQSTAARTTRATFDATEEGFWTQIGVDTTDLETGLAGKMDNPTGTKTTGYVPVVQSGGAVAWTAQSGGGTPTAATVSYAGSPSLPTNPATVEDALDVLASGAAVTVSAGTNLATARPVAALVYWKFSAGVDVGWDGVNITNAASGDLVFVAGRRGPIVVGGAQDRVLSRVAYEVLTPDANTRYDILDPLLVQDLFLGRTDTNGWGTAEKGGAYAHTGTLADWSTTTNTGRVILSAANQDKIATLTTVTSTDWDRAVLVTLDEVPVGASAALFLLVRVVRASTWFRAWLTINTTGTVTLALSRLIDGVESTLQAATTISGLTFTANKKLWIRARAVGTSPTLLEAKVWEYGTAQPSTWQRSITNSEADLQAVGGCGLHFRAGTGNTNFPFTAITYMHGDYET